MDRETEREAQREKNGDTHVLLIRGFNKGVHGALFFPPLRRSANRRVDTGRNSTQYSPVSTAVATETSAVTGGEDEEERKCYKKRKTQPRGSWRLLTQFADGDYRLLTSADGVTV